MKAVRVKVVFKDGEDIVDIVEFENGESEVTYHEGAIDQYLIYKDLISPSASYEQYIEAEAKFITQLEHLAMEGEEVKTTITLYI